MSFREGISESTNSQNHNLNFNKRIPFSNLKSLVSEFEPLARMMLQYIRRLYIITVAVILTVADVLVLGFGSYWFHNRNMLVILLIQLFNPI